MVRVSRVFLVALAGFVLAAAPAVAAVSAADADSVDIAFVLIPAGSYVSGSPGDEWGSRVDEKQHRVTLSHAFYLSTTEITQTMWRAVMGNNPSYLYDCPRCPVEGLSWFDAIAFCNAFSQQAGLAPVYAIRDTLVTWDRTADGYRLPTEAEWEYACRAGSATAFHTGDCLGTDKANYKGYEPQEGCASGLWRGQTIDVGSFAANNWELCDMHGNVGEWCWDRWDFYPDTATVDPAGPDRGDERVIRGGNFDRPAWDCRSAARTMARPRAWFRDVGVRLARTAFTAADIQGGSP